MKQSNTNSFSLVEAGGLASPYISMSDAEAIELVSIRFGQNGRVTRFATEKDDTFRVDADNGQRFILKVANPSEDVSEIDFQVGLLRHIAAFDQSIPVPRVISDVDGNAYTTIQDDAGQQRQVRMMSYIDGTPLDSTSASATERERVGEMLGALRLATATYTHQAESRVLAWDVKHLLSLYSLLDEIKDEDKRKLLTSGFYRFAAMASQVEQLRTQVVHNDFSKSNIVVDHDQPTFVTGIIDFGDAVRTAVAIDVSTAMLNQFPRDAAQRPVDDLFAEGRDLLRGYLRVASLTNEELALIPHLAMGRVITRALLTLWRARLLPGNAEYILRNTEQGWAQLDWFLQRSPQQVSDTLLAGVAV